MCFFSLLGGCMALTRFNSLLMSVYGCLLAFNRLVIAIHGLDYVVKGVNV